MPEPTKTIHLRLPEHLHARLAEYARRTRRSMSAAGVVLLEQALEREQESGMD